MLLRATRQLTKLNRTMFQQRGFALAAQDLQKALSSSDDLSQVAASAEASDIDNADSKWMSEYIQVLTKAESEEGFDASQQSEAVNEYFRKQFRKMNT